MPDTQDKESGQKPALHGGKVSYYLVQVPHPQRSEQPPYQAECEDIIQALGMTFDEGCLFKALWRLANARKGNGKPGQSALYDAEKMVHYASRILRQAQLRQQGVAVIVAEAEADPPEGWILTNGTIPMTLRPSDKVEVEYRCGERSIDYVSCFSWKWYSDQHHLYEIVRYRKLS